MRQLVDQVCFQPTTEETAHYGRTLFLSGASDAAETVGPIDPPNARETLHRPRNAWRRKQSRRAVARELRMTYRTVQRLADAAPPEDLFQGQWQNRRTKLYDFKPCLHERWAEGHTNAWTLWKEIQTHRYAGGCGAVSAYLRPFRGAVPGGRPPSPRTVAGWILTHPDALAENERLKLKSVLTHCPELDALARHVRSFGQMLTPRQGERLPEWIAAVRTDDLPSLHTFINGLERNLAALTAGPILPCSSGVVEGHVNRIKMIKRQMYGRSGFKLLRKRVSLYS